MESIPGECFGFFGMPAWPNECEKCEAKELCKYTAKHFVPKKKLQPIFQRLLALEKSMGERIIDELLRGLADLCASLEESFKQFREKVAALALEATAWKTLLAPSPIDPNDRAFRWLIEKCLPEVARKHPEVRWDLIKTENGKIAGLRYFCQDQETENDIVKPTTWSFEVACNRPLADSKNKK